MNASEALARLRALAVPAFTTADAAATLGLSIEAASQTLRRLAASGLATFVRRSLWTLATNPDPLVLAEYVTAPYPSYVSLQTALYLHGMVSQVPSMTYLVSLARAGRVNTRIGTYSVHHVVPAFFGGFEHRAESGLKIATPEKALVDFLYLSPSRTRLFTALPELELPRAFRVGVARDWAKKVPSKRLRTIVVDKLEAALRAARPERGGARPP